MAKKVVTRYSLPITDEERKEIQEILTPLYEDKERRNIADELQVSLLNSVTHFLSITAPAYDGRTVSGGIDVLKRELQESANAWYARYLPRLGSYYRPEDIHVSVSTDGLYILKYSDTVKHIITKADFELEKATVTFPYEDGELVDQVNEYLEQRAQEE